MNIAAASRGGASGAVATVVMTVVLLAARRLGIADPPAPEAVVVGTLEQAHLSDDVRPPSRTVLVSVAHLAYGAAMGVLYAIGLPHRHGHPLVVGTAFGLVVWAASYLGWLPLARILPPPRRQGVGRHVENVCSHTVYGAVLGTVEARLGSRTSRNGVAGTTTG